MMMHYLYSPNMLNQRAAPRGFHVEASDCASPVSPPAGIESASTRVRCGSASASASASVSRQTDEEQDETFVMKRGRRTSIDAATPSALLTAKHGASSSSGTSSKRTSSKRRSKKAVRFPLDDTEFYSNIWNPPVPPTSGPSKKFIDITQIAFVVASLGDKHEYQDAQMPQLEQRNVWSDYGSDTDMETNGDADGDIETDEPETSPVQPERARDGKRPRRFPSIREDESEENGGSTSHGSVRISDTVQAVPVAPPSRRDDRHAVFSAVLSTVNFNVSWSARFLLALHEPIRHALYVIDRFLEQTQEHRSPEHWNAQAFFQWFTQYFAQFVEAQNTTKLQVLQPLLQIRYPIKREILDCYEEVMFMLETVGMHEEILSSMAADEPVAWLQSIAVLQADIRKLNEVLRHTLNLEEQTLQPLLQSTFSEKAFEDHIMPRVLREMQHKRIVIPWIVERCRVWGGDEQADAFKQHLSLPSRFLYDHRWYPFFSHYVAGAMKTLDASLVNFPKEDEGSWFGCSIQ